MHACVPRYRSMMAADAVGSRALQQRGWIALAGPLLVFLGVLAIACVHYRGQTLARGPDQADMLLSFFHEASHAVEEEGLLAAMYTPGVRAGVPNWSNPNYHPLYPLYFNWAGADATVEDTLDRLNFIVYLHLAILGAGAFALARALGVRRLPAIAVGLVLPWFPAVRSAAAWPHIIAGMAWLPWIFAFQARLYAAAPDHRSPLGAVAGLAACATLLAYAQPAQNLVFAAFGSALLWTLVAVQLALRRDRNALRAFVRTSAWLALAAAVVLAATGGYLLEILRFHAQSIRWLGEYGGYVVGDQPVPVGALRVHALPWQDARLLLAFEYRKGIGNAYLGAAVLVAAAALCSRAAAWTPKIAVARALLAAALLAALFCFAFMAPLLGRLPVVGAVRELSWWSCLAAVLLAPLAAAGLQALWSDRGEVPAWRRDPWSAAAILAFALAFAATWATPAPYRVEAALVLVAGFVALAWSLRAPSQSARTRDLACALLLACTAWIPFRHNIEFARRDATLFLPDRVQARTDAARLRALLPDEDVYRIVLAGTLPNAHLLTHAYAALGFRSIHGGIGPADHAKHALLSMANPAVSALYGVKYILLPAASAPGDVALRPGLALRTDAAALPRLFFVGGGLRVVDDPVAALRALDDPSPLHAFAARRDLPAGFDVATFAYGAPLLSTPALAENRRTRLRAVLASDRPGLLVLNEDPEARWHARIDGEEVTAFRINGFQTAFAIPAPGRHVVEIERPGRLFGTTH
jgi:hypothetical protein